MLAVDHRDHHILTAVIPIGVQFRGKASVVFAGTVDGNGVIASTIEFVTAPGWDQLLGTSVRFHQPPPRAWNNAAVSA